RRVGPVPAGLSVTGPSSHRAPRSRRAPWVAGAALGVLALGSAAALVAFRDQPGDLAAPPPTTTTTAGPATPFPDPSPAARRVFPVLGEASYGRTHHGYPGTDIFAPCGATYVAVYSGVVHEVNRKDRY